MIDIAGALRSSVIIGVFATLVGCDRLPDDRVCSMVFPVAADLPDLLNKGEVARNCVQKWGYRLAKSQDPADKVADAVMGACWDTIYPWAYARMVDAKSVTASEKTISSRSGREVNFVEETYEQLHARALFHVVQARAGRCQIP